MQKVKIKISLNILFMVIKKIEDGA